MENLQERIAKKEAQIVKIEKAIKKYSQYASERLIKACEEHNYQNYKLYESDYRNNEHYWYAGDLWSKYSDLQDAKNTLAKYKQMVISENNKNATLSELPESIQTFRASIIARWNAYDYWKKEEIKRIYCNESIEYKERKNKLFDMFGRCWHEFMYLTDDQIAKQNEKDANTLILNMINRVIELTGKITDTRYLELNQDNNGFTIINGIIIGEKGKAKIESILAGGYNIQRLHVRVLVKDVK